VRQLGWRRAFVAGAWAIGPFVALVVAMMAYNQALSGRFALSTYPVVDGEFRIIAGEHLGFIENVTTIADEYVRRFVYQAKVLAVPYFVWPAGITIPLLAMAALFLRAGDRTWRLVLWVHFVVVVLLYNFHGVRSPVPTWPLYGARYWYSGFGALVVLAAMTMRAVAERPWGQRLAQPRIARALVGVAVAANIAIGVPLFREYSERFDVVFAVQRDIERTCPGKRIVGLELPGRAAMPTFVRASDFKRNPFFTGEKLYVYGVPTPEIVRAFPGYTACYYDFRTWPSAL
jgi:hypothetical protein